ncbi:MAG: flavodoxin family protein [Firmicutes bacterium]|nr:flavodoxin family protein [Bacillota bacterium]
MRLVIHDLESDYFEQRFSGQLSNWHVISPTTPIHHCLGCFGCWVKTPGACVIQDQYANLGELLALCQEVLIISRCCYGGFSPFVKNVLDRSIPYIHPFFVNKHGEMHHRRRYSNRSRLKVWFYGETTEHEKITALGLVQANAVNFWWEAAGVEFYGDPAEMEGRMP